MKNKFKKANTIIVLSFILMVSHFNNVYKTSNNIVGSILNISKPYLEIMSQNYNDYKNGIFKSKN